MAYSDEWWKSGNASSHNSGPGYDWGIHLPDGHVDEEYWGIFEIAPDGEKWLEYPWNQKGDGLDEIRPRKVYEVLKTLYTAP